MTDAPGYFPVYLILIPFRVLRRDGPLSITLAEIHMRLAMRNRSASGFWRKISAMASSIISKRGISELMAQYSNQAGIKNGKMTC